MKKKTAAKTDALCSSLFRNKMAIERMAKKVYKKSPETARKHWLHCHIKLQPMNKLEKVTKCYTAENSYQDSILDLHLLTLA